VRAELLQLLQAAQQHHQAGRFAEAEAGYRRVLEKAPDDPAATHFLGLLKYQTGSGAAGLELMARSVARPSPAPDFLFNYGVALDQQGRWIEAIPFYQRTVQLRPQFPDALVNLAAALGKFRRFDEGIALCRRALALRPGWDLAQFNLGQCLKGQGLVAHFAGRPTEAVELYRPALGMRKLLQLKPPASEKMLETRPTASRSRVSGLDMGLRPARTSGCACESRTGKLRRSLRVLPSRARKLRSVVSSRA